MKNYICQQKGIGAAVIMGVVGYSSFAAEMNESKKQSQRNIVVILFDTVRPDFLNPYGFKAMETSGVNSLAKMGVVFDNAVTASPVSAPARASMMTGLYPSGHGVWTNDLPFKDGVEFLSNRMNAMGYETAAFGVMDHYPADDPKGYKTFVPLEAYLQFLKDKYPNEKIVSLSHFSKGFEFTKPMEEYYDYWVCSNTIDFLRQHKEKNTDTPFLVWMSLQGPHPPFDPPKEMHGKVDGSKIPLPVKVKSSNRASAIEYRSAAFGINERTDKETVAMRLAYAEKLKLDDEQIERVVSELKKLGLLENTTIIFSADHGGLLGDYGLDDKGPYPYSPSLNIPLIVANHPAIGKGIRSDILVSNIDIPGTCLAIAGDKKPIGVSHNIIDMVDPSSKIRRKVNFSEFNDTFKMVEDKQYRYSYFPFEQKSMMFDKKNDPEFQNDIAGESKYAALELKFMKSLMDFQCISKGFHIEAQDFTPVMQKGASEIHPNWLEDNFVICFPLGKRAMNNIKNSGLDYHHNDLFIGRKVHRSYGYFWK